MSDILKAVIVTGPLRSGGSAVANVLNSLGVPMGLEFLAPIPPTYRQEWEDRKLQKWLLETDATDSRWLKAYWTKRARKALDYADTFGVALNAVGVKTPFLATVLPEVIAAAVEAGLEPLVIETKRDPQMIARSFERSIGPFLKCLEPEKADEWRLRQTRIVEALRGYEFDRMAISYERLVEFPHITVAAIAALVGIPADDPLILSAVECVKRPTTGARK